jgi:hypothetical protein
MNVTENDSLVDMISPKNPREFIALKPEPESPQD